MTKLKTAAAIAALLAAAVAGPAGVLASTSIPI